jgi:hypothetical protein
MNDIAIARPHIAAMSPATIDKVRQLETMVGAMPQIEIRTDHVFHAGVYARTVLVPAGAVITGVLIKIPTILIVNGDAIVHTEGGPIELHGYHVLQAAAGRKQALVALTDTHLTMIFASDASDPDTAEREFTDEIDNLMSRKET